MRGDQRRQPRHRGIAGEGRVCVRLAGRGQCVSRRACLRHRRPVRPGRVRMVVCRGHRCGRSRYGEARGFHDRPASRHSGARRPNGAPGPERMRDEQQHGDGQTRSTASTCAAGCCPPESRKHSSLSLHNYIKIYLCNTKCNSAPTCRCERALPRTRRRHSCPPAWWRYQFPTCSWRARLQVRRGVAERSSRRALDGGAERTSRRVG